MKRLLLFIILLSLHESMSAQVFCPPNIDFEQNSLSYWNCYTSSNTGTGIYSWSLTGPITGRHTITSGVALDPYGGFPITAPGGGLHAIKLGNDGTGAQMEKVSYTISIPVGAANYSLIYRYAVVFQDPSHTVAQQPFFRVAAYDSATNNLLPCNNSTYISSGNLPGFIETAPNSNIWYKDWTTATLKLDGLAGRTIIVEFTTADCSASGHFGYGYVDMSCGSYAITSANCNASPTTPLIAPPGFQSYTWFDNGYTTILGSGQTITVPTPATTMYYHVVLEPFPGYGCIDTLTTKILFSTLSVNATPDSSSLCTAASVQLNTLATGSAPPFSYSWTPTPGLSCAYCPNPSAVPVNNTLYVVSVTDSIGCTIKDSVYVTAGMTVSTTQQNATCAAAQNGSATVNIIGGTAPFTYSWNTIPVQTTATATGLLPGPYTCTITDAGNCTATKNVTIGITPMTLTETHVNVFCSSATDGQAAITVSGGTPPYSYSWNTTPVQTTPLATNLPQGTYTCTVTDAWGCTGVKAVAIGIVPFTITEVHTNVSCFGGNNGAATVNVVVGGAGPFTYSWNTTPVQTTATATGLTVGTYICTISNGICTGTKTVVITQPNTLVPAANATNIYCSTLSTGSVSVIPSGGTPPYSYSWNLIPVQTTPTINGLPAGTYICTITDAKGCTASISKTVIETAPIHVDATIVARACEGLNGNIVTSTPIGGSGTIHYYWNTTPSRFTQTINNLATGTYIVTITDSIGCSAKDTVTVVSYPKPVVTASADIELCFGESTALNVTGAGAYVWSPPTGLSCTNCAAPVANPATTTTYSVIGTDANGCKDTALVKVSIIEKMAASIDSDRAICFGDKVMLGAVGGGSYQWTPEETLQGSFLPNPVASPTTTTTYTVIITENRCFKDTLTETITVMPLPTIDIMNGFNGIPGATVQLNCTVTNAHTITWTPPKWLSCYDCQNPIATLTENVIYVAEVTDTFGCKARDTIRITVGCNSDAFYMANTFTPNNDGRNDYFYPQAFGINTVSRFMIYNRWGETVFAAKDIPVNVPERGWNGTYMGKELPPDVFVFAIEAICADGTPVVLKGDVTLVR